MELYFERFRIPRRYRGYEGVLKDFYNSFQYPINHTLILLFGGRVSIDTYLSDIRDSLRWIPRFEVGFGGCVYRFYWLNFYVSVGFTSEHAEYLKSSILKNIAKQTA